LPDPTSQLMEDAPPEPPDPLIGRMLAGKYRLEKKLGEGGMGAVYRARQVALEKTIAVKVMHSELASDPMFAARFHREAKAASRLDHVNSIDIHDFGEEPDGLLYIAMEFLDGKDLLAILDEEAPLPTGRIVDILSQALSALGVAHDMGIIHRDLKPENIMVLRRKGEDERIHDVVKVCDFGIAKVADAVEEEAVPSRAKKGKLTTAGLVIGTPEYMSPEQGRGEPLDARCDLYSMGVILYLLLSGQTPFDAPTPLGIVLKHQNEQPLPPSRIRPLEDLRLETVCLKAISKRPGDRYASAREMRSALRAVVDGTVSEGSLAVMPPTQLSHAAHARTELLMQAPTQAVAAREGTGSLPRDTAALVISPQGDLAHDAARATSAVIPVETGTAAAARPPSHTAAKAVAAILAVALVGGGGFYGWTLLRHDSAGEASAAAKPSPEPPPPPPHASKPEPTAQPSVPPPVPARPEAFVQAPVTPPMLKQKNAALGAVSGEKKSLGEAVMATPPPPPEPPPPPPVEAPVAPPPSPPQPHAMPVEPPLPPFDPAGAHVEAGSASILGGGVNARAVNGVVNSALGRVTTCYRQAATASSPEGSWNLRITSDDEGNITEGRLDGPLPEQVKTCISRAFQRATLKVDTGAVTATVMLTFKLR
jgi:serine/threonine protein kinase